MYVYVCMYGWMSVHTIKMWPIFLCFFLLLIFVMFIRQLFSFPFSAHCFVFVCVASVSIFSSSSLAYTRNFFSYTNIFISSISLFTMMILFSSLAHFGPKKKWWLLLMIVWVVCVYVCACAVVVVLYFPYCEALQRIHWRWKFSQIENQQHQNERWEMWRWFWSCFSPVMMPVQLVYMYRFNDDVLFFTFSGSIHFSRHALMCGPKYSFFLSILFVSYELN